MNLVTRAFYLGLDDATVHTHTYFSKLLLLLYTSNWNVVSGQDWVRKGSRRLGLILLPKLYTINEGKRGGRKQSKENGMAFSDASCVVLFRWFECLRFAFLVPIIIVRVGERESKVSALFFRERLSQ